MLGVHDGIRPADANTSAALICEALAQAGAPIDPRPVPESDATAYSAVYRVDMRPLGQLVVVQVTLELPPGTRRRSRSVQLADIEEVPVAAPRLADALHNDKPLESTATVDTLLGQETRTYRKEYGETLFGVGVFGMSIPDETFAGYGAFGRLHYEAARYAVGIDLRVGGSSRDDGDASLVGLSVGGRWFTGSGDITPFIGGGAGILWLGMSRRFERQSDSLYSYDAYDYSSEDGSGLALFAEVGVEFLRFHDSRLDLLLRADIPTFDLEGNGSDRYRVPIALMASYSLD